MLVTELLDAAREPTLEGRRRRATAVGAEAADRGLPVRDLAAAVMEAGVRYWAELDVGRSGDARAVHAKAAGLLDRLAGILDAAAEGLHERARSELSTRDGERTAFLHDLLAGRVDPGALAGRAQRYGIRLQATHQVIVVRAAGLTTSSAQRIDAALAARFGEGNTLTTLRETDLVCITAGGLRGVPAELAHLLLGEFGPGHWQLGVGRIHHGVGGIAASLDEARGALELADRLGFTAPILNAADLLVFPVLLRDRDAILDLVTSVLGPLTEARGGAELYLHTLSVLFDNQGNTAATARHLHLSVRAVTYRLDRIRALTGYHPSEPTQRFTLQAAVLGARLMDWPSSADG
jgi:sugar diacid utilization regulator